VPEQALLCSVPFDYLIATDSLVPGGEIEALFRAVEAAMDRRLRADPTLDYVGMRPRRLVRPLGLSDLDVDFVPETVAGAFATEEVAGEPARVGLALERAVAACPGIRFLPWHRVASARASGAGFRLRGDWVEPSARRMRWSGTYDQVVNALWLGRLAVDRSLGAPLPESWNYRLTLRV